MNKITYLVMIVCVMVGCSKDEHLTVKINDGTYIGTFQREPVWSSSKTANITMIFSSNHWSGSTDIVKYPALCHGMYSIVGDSIVFENECAWTAEFDWSLILSGKYLIKESGDTIELSRDYRSATTDTWIDKYKIKRQN
jgi:hypothetical protein